MRRLWVPAVRDFPDGCGPMESVCSDLGVNENYMSEAALELQGSDQPKGADTQCAENDNVVVMSNVMEADGCEPMEEVSSDFGINENYTSEADYIQDFVKGAESQYAEELQGSDHIEEMHSADTQYAETDNVLVMSNVPLNAELEAMALGTVELSELLMNWDSHKPETTGLTENHVLSCGLQARPPLTLISKDDCIEEKAPSWDFLPRKKIFAIRDFPSFCGPNAPFLSNEDRVTALTASKSTGIGQKGTVAEDKFKNGTIGTKFKEKGVEERRNKEVGCLNAKIGKERHDTMLQKSNIVKKIQVCTKDVGLHHEMDRKVVPALMAAPNFSYGFSMKKKLVTKKLEIQSLKRKRMSSAYHQVFKLYEHEDVKSFQQDEELTDSHKLNVYLPPLGKASSSGKHDDHGAVVTRNKVRETLRLFQVVCRKLLQGEEAKSKSEGWNGIRRIDLLAGKIVKSKGKYVNTGKPIFGSVPGVEVGDEFLYRVELAMVGLHRPLQAGIDSLKIGSKLYATSVVASGAYDDDVDDADVLVYMGCGGNRTGNNQPEDQKLEGGNLALRNCALEKRAVRVIRGFKKLKVSDAPGVCSKMVSTLTYDGLYTVDRCWQEKAEPDGKLVFKFLLVRIRGQPGLAWSEVKKSRKLEIRPGICVADISRGKEIIPICAINTINDEKPPQFRYISKIMYPDWCKRIPQGCGCTHGCLECDKCSCAIKNGSVIPYNHNGAIVEAKPLVYECGPYCKCPPSCYNRVSQHGIKIKLEIFKTVSRGWGVRSVNSISSGSFICEYVGELLEDNEAEKRTGSDEYLFDIGRNYGVGGGSSEDVEDGEGFTIDAARYGNVGRFINHSCSPNLYTQNVLYDHKDKRIPHIMLFAAENIPPLKELTFHYNYTIDQVFDSDGNIKKKRCYCGSSECMGRLY